MSSHPAGLRTIVLGTGAADGLPQPFCACATCSDARSRGRARLPGGVLIDSTLLIDAPATLTATTARAGVDLRQVRAIAVTHAHHDHWDPSILLHRQWIDDHESARETSHPQLAPLTLIGPPAVLESARPWLPAASNVTLVPAVVGESHEVAGHRITVLPATHGRARAGEPTDPWAAEAVLYDVRSAGASLLYAADTGAADDALLAAVADAAYDAVFLELTFGVTAVSPDEAASPSTPGHLDHTTFPAFLADLRKVGAVTSATEVIAIHIGHHNPPEAQLRHILAGWGARLVDDGTELQVGDGAPSGRAGACILATGGARSGKSAYVEARAADSGRPVTYVATGYPATSDGEWADRIAAHRRRRPAEWRTRETADVAAALTAAPDGECVIVDCLTLWLTRVIDAAQAWERPDAARAAADAAVTDLLAALADAGRRDVEVLLVTNEVGSGVVPERDSGRLFRDLLGSTNAGVAAVCDHVVLLVAGRPLVLERNLDDVHAR